MSFYSYSVGGAVYNFNTDTMELEYCYNKILVAKGLESIKYKFVNDTVGETENKK